ncbi:vitelline membrane protein 15a-2-like isoform X2 [Ostrinia furnacalis]|uniref:vitelline membrane protein 15a-2-like isoform X2 n=1 Tax=Ostrinia furnacalis TaxID=93504 RepID=UPI001039BB41|nr:vitelline membrane protein 15a-2-like isoform X2 [Ostrinia furnacalis]
MKLLSCFLLVTTIGLACGFAYYPAPPPPPPAPSPPPLCSCPPPHLVPYEPLCGSNYKTYPNKCELGCDHSQGVGGIFVLYKGPCVSHYLPPPPPSPGSIPIGSPQTAGSSAY